MNRVNFAAGLLDLWSGNMQVFSCKRIFAIQGSFYRMVFTISLADDRGIYLTLKYQISLP